ncbi:DJ-1/PfpI family protein [Streptomyces sp. NPDC020362]|uniref:DJ-1/PfpI family protein n=1 Tax=unclassified Streptomyces TaxID=2593676 RepID=UPI0033F12738
MTDTLTLGVLLFEDVKDLDLVGPWEVLGLWASPIASSPGQLLAVGPDAGAVVVCSKGLRLAADCGTTTAPPLDVLVHPGGLGTRTLVRDDRHPNWPRGLHEGGTVLVSVCTGSPVPAAAGLPAGRPATTHHHYLDDLTKIDGLVDGRARDRYVDDGDVISSAGVSAGIDMALHLVALPGGAEASGATRAGIQYGAPAGRGI